MRRQLKEGERAHHKQLQKIKGRDYFVSKVKNPSMVAVAAAQGFTEVKCDER